MCGITGIIWVYPFDPEPDPGGGTLTGWIRDGEKL
jgi:hypothetical protein